MWMGSTPYKRLSAESGSYNDSKDEMPMASQTPCAQFSHAERVRYADTDAQGHVFFGNYYTYMDEAFMAYLGELGYPWARLVEMGVEIYYAASNCQYKGRAFFGDRLHIYPEISGLGNSSLTVAMRVIRAGDGEKVVAEGTITGVFMEIASGQSTPMPEAFREAVRRYQDGRPSA